MTPEPGTDNLLYYGDNLKVLPRHVAAESVDLIYLDPPFNSNRAFNVLFEKGHEEDQEESAQIHALEDTWRWDQSAAEAFASAVESKRFFCHKC